MIATDDQAAIDRLELRVGRLLEAGVRLAAACLGIGLALWFVLGDGRPANLLMTTGLVVLMVTPLARVVAALVTYVRLRDWVFATTTVMVFVVLIAAWLLKA